MAFGNLGNAFDSLGQYDKAIEFHTKQFNIARELGIGLHIAQRFACLSQPCPPTQRNAEVLGVELDCLVVLAKAIERNTQAA